MQHPHVESVSVPAVPSSRTRREVVRRSYAEADLCDCIAQAVSDRIVRKGIGRMEFEREYGRENRVHKIAKYAEATALSLTSWMNLAEAMGCWEDALSIYAQRRGVAA